jgi:hypothetical protein
MDQLALMMQPRAARTLQQQQPDEAAAAARASAARAEAAEAAEFGASPLPAPTSPDALGRAADVPRESEEALRAYMRPRLPVAAGGRDLAYTPAAEREGAARFFSPKESAFVPAAADGGNGGEGGDGASYGYYASNDGKGSNGGGGGPGYDSRGPGAKNGTLFLSRGALRLGVDCARGATIFYLGLEAGAAREGERAAAGVPGDLLGKSLVNGYDCGRGLQQSYYGCWDGSCWPPGKSWLYNPVQCGSWTDKPSTVMRCEMLGVDEAAPGPSSSSLPAAQRAKRALIDDAADASYLTGAPGSPSSPDRRQRIVTSVIPRNWGGGQLLPEVRMDSDIALSPKGEVARIRFSMTYGTEAARLANARIAAPPAHPLRMQEVPAVFVDRRLSSLVFYNRTKDREWTDAWGKLTLARPRATNDYFLPTERWAAYVFPGTGWGVGVYSPNSDVVTAYRVGPDPPAGGKPPPTSDVSYFAPTVKFPLTPGRAYTYDVYVAVGAVGDLRAHFARIAERTGRAPAGSARAMADAAGATTADVGARAARGLVGGAGGGLVEGAPAPGGARGGAGGGKSAARPPPPPPPPSG